MFEHDYPFDPTHGYSLDELLAIVPPSPVADFETFWRETYARTRATPLNISLEPCRFSNQDVEAFEIYFDGLDGFRCGGWLTRPRHEKPLRGVVHSHGYGGRISPETAVPGPPAVVLYPCARGFSLSARSDLPADTPEHVIHHLQSRDEYIHRGCVADIWASVTALLELHPEFEGKIDFIGGSFGGGIGALALPWDDRFHRAFLRVPSFGHQPLRTTLPCTGSGQYVSAMLREHPELLTQVLAYYDSAVAAQFTRLPVLVSPALFDPAVPPPGQFAVYNALTGPKAVHIIEAGHFTWRGLVLATRDQNARAAQWFETGR
jgi:cephalosporin-C deacetylase